MTETIIEFSGDKRSNWARAIRAVHKETVMPPECLPKKLIDRLVKRGDIINGDKILVRLSPHVGWSVHFSRPVMGLEKNIYGHIRL
jgi:hypothetical protein